MLQSKPSELPGRPSSATKNGVNSIRGVGVATVNATADSADVHYSRANELYGNLMLADAVLEMRLAVEAQPSFMDACETLAYWQRELEDANNDETALRARYAQSPDDLANALEFASVLRVVGKPDEARTLLTEVSELDSGYLGKRARRMLMRMNSAAGTVRRTGPAAL